MMRFCRSCTTLVFWIALYPRFACAQSASISGTVTDEHGAVVPDSAITLTNVNQGVQRQTTTNSVGVFVFALLPPGNYRARVEHQGFGAAELNDIILNVDDQPSLRITLQLSAVIQSVNVQASAPLLQTESATVGTLVDRHFVENMPLNGRSIQSLIELTAGVVYTMGGGNLPGQFAVNGQRQDTNQFTVDGTSANSGILAANGIGVQGTGGAPSMAANGGFNTLVSVDNLQEFRVQTSGFAPEYGRSPGGQISIVTRSGANRFTGTLFDYFRNTVLDANNWFNNANGLPKSPEQQNDFGGVLGGPLIKNKLFFFFSYEGLRLLQPVTAQFYVPSLALRQIQSGLQPYFQSYVLPNGPVSPTNSNLALFNGSYSNPTELDNSSIRIDAAPWSKTTIFGRFNTAPSGVDTRLGSSVVRTATTMKSATVGVTYISSPSLINDFRLNYTGSTGGQISRLDTYGGAIPFPDSYAFPAGHDSTNSLFTVAIQVGAGVTTQSRTGVNAVNRQVQYNVVDTVSKVWNGHQMKFGADYRRLNPTNQPRDFDIQGTLTNSAAYAAGIADTITVTSNGSQDFLFQNLGLFAQDTWKASKRLTLTYGLRWDWSPAPTFIDNHPGFTLTPLELPVSSISIQPLGTQPAYPTTYRNFAPRLGAAYQLSRSQKWGTVVRGGWGVFFDTAASANQSASGPYANRRVITNTTFPLTGANALAPGLPANPPYNPNGPAPDLKLPYVYQTNFTIEQGLGGNQSLTMSYVGAFGRRLLRQEVYQVSTSATAFINTINAIGNNAQSNYNSLQTQFQRRLSHGLQATGQFTWSHSIDNASRPNSANGNHLQPGFLNRERGNSDFDVRRIASAALGYNIPSPSNVQLVKAILGNWGSDAIYRYSGATPLDIAGNTVVDPTTGTSYTSRPNLNADIPVYLDGAYPGGRRINPAAFTAAPAGKQGNLGRNVVRGLPVHQVDVALRRDFPLRERYRLQFRADFFNILNHPNFGNPPVAITQPAVFGIANAMLSNALSATGFSPLYQIGSPRSVQFSLKFAF